MKMKMYMSVFRIRLINNMQYRVVMFGAIITRFVWGLMEILAFAAVYKAGGTTAFPMEFSQTVSYIWLYEALMVLFSVVFSDSEIYTTIENGSIAYELVRPINLYGRWFCQSVANRVSFTLLNCLPVLLLACFMPKPYNMSLPISAEQFILSLLSTVFALCVVVAFAMLMYISLFYLLSQRGIRIIVMALTTFFSGGVVPLPFFPKPLLTIVQFLPFASMQNMPLLIYSGNVAGMDALKGIVLQLFWIVVLFFFGQFAMRRALKKVVVQGG